jgi:hypothetical protein
MHPAAGRRMLSVVRMAFSNFSAVCSIWNAVSARLDESHSLRKRRWSTVKANDWAHHWERPGPCVPANERHRRDWGRNAQRVYRRSTCQPKRSSAIAFRSKAGELLPALSIIISIALLRRRRFIPVNLRPRRGLPEQTQQCRQIGSWRHQSPLCTIPFIASVISSGDSTTS